MNRELIFSKASNSGVSIVNNVCLNNQYNQLFYSEPLYEVGERVSTLMVYGKFNKKCTKVKLEVLVDGIKSEYRIGKPKFEKNVLIVPVKFYENGDKSAKIKFNYISGDQIITKVILKGMVQEETGILPPKICDTLFI